MLTKKKDRTDFFPFLDLILNVSEKKFSTETIKANERRKWARIGIAAIQTYGKLLEENKLEQVAKDISEIKPLIIKKWCIENESGT